MREYVIVVGGPGDPKGLGAWAREMHAKQRDIKNEIRKSARNAANIVAEDARQGFRSGIKQQPAMAKSIKTDMSFGAPAVRYGGRVQLNLGAPERGRNEKGQYTKAGKRKRRPILAGEIAAGAEFGGRRKNTPPRYKPWTGSAKQFPARTAKLGRGNEGYFFYPAVRRGYKKVMEMFSEDLDRIFGR